MGDSLQELYDLDNFFYYGCNEIPVENKSDLMLLVMQPKNSLFYNRQDGAGIPDFENSPMSFSQQVSIRYSIAQAVSRRNGITTNGQNNTKDRRIAVSQNSISIESNDNGELDIGVTYFDYYNYTVPQNIMMPIGGM